MTQENNNTRRIDDNKQPGALEWDVTKPYSLTMESQLQAETHAGMVFFQNGAGDRMWITDTDVATLYKRLFPRSAALASPPAEAPAQVAQGNRALREVQRMQVDPKLAKTGGTAYERFLYAELTRLQSAVLADTQPADARVIGHITTGEIEGDEISDWDIEFDHKVIATMPEFLVPEKTYEIYIRALSPAAVAASGVAK